MVVSTAKVLANSRQREGPHKNGISLLCALNSRVCTHTFVGLKKVTTLKEKKQKQKTKTLRETKKDQVNQNST